MAIAETAAPRFEMGRVVRRTFSVIGHNLVTFALLSLIAALPATVHNQWTAQSDADQFSLIGIVETAAGLLVYVISAFILQAALVHGTVADLSGKRASFVDCLSTGFRHLLPLIVIALLYSLFVAVGFLFFVVPGIIVAVMMSVAVPARLVEHTPVMVAFDRSQDLTRGYRWPIFGLLLAFFIAQMIISMTIFSIVGLSLLSRPTPEQVASTTALATTWPVIVASTIVSIINGVVGATGTASIYYELRQIKEGVGPEALAAVFD